MFIGGRIHKNNRHYTNNNNNCHECFRMLYWPVSKMYCIENEKHVPHIKFSTDCNTAKCGINCTN